MTFMQVKLICTWGWRWFKQGITDKVLRVLFVAVLVGVASITAVLMFEQRVDTSIEATKAAFLGGDATITASTPINPGWRQHASEIGLATSTSVSTLSMAQTAAGKLQLVEMFAVEANYPLRGNKAGNPKVGTVWVEPEVIQTMALQLQDSITLGIKEFKVTSLTPESISAVGPVLKFAPQVMLNLSDLAATKLLQPGSRAEYTLYLAGSKSQLDAYLQWLQPQLTEAEQLQTLQKVQPRVKSFFENGSNFLKLNALLAFLLAGITIVKVVTYYAQQQIKAVALLRCLGATANVTWLGFAVMLFVLGIIAGGLGGLLGLLGERLLELSLAGLFAFSPYQFNLDGLFVGLSLALVLLLGFGLTPLLNLKKIPPAAVFRTEKLPKPTFISIVVMLAAFMLVVGLLLYRFKAWNLLLVLFSGITIIVACALIIVYLLIKLIIRLGKQAPLGVKLALLSLRSNYEGPIITFSLLFMLTITIFIVHKDMLAAWQTQLDPNLHNNYVINILPDQKDSFVNALDNNAIDHAALYPIFRGRIAKINANAIKFHRPLNLTWAAEVPAENYITAGQWWQGMATDMPLISVEVDFAERLGIQLGDTMEFQIGTTTVVAKVVNLRSLDWNTMLPNFYIVFNSGTLPKLPVTYMTSLRMPDASPSKAAIVQQFPNATFVDVSRIINQIQVVLQQLSSASYVGLIFTFILALTLLYTNILVELKRRYKEAGLLRVFGATRKLILQANLFEFGIVGFIAAMLALVGANIIAILIAVKVLQINYIMHYGLAVMLVLICISTILTAVFGLVQRIAKYEPVRILRRL